MLPQKDISLSTAIRSFLGERWQKPRHLDRAWKPICWQCMMQRMQVPCRIFSRSQKSVPRERRYTGHLKSLAQRNASGKTHIHFQDPRFSLNTSGNPGRKLPPQTMANHGKARQSAAKRSKAQQSTAYCGICLFFPVSPLATRRPCKCVASLWNFKVNHGKKRTHILAHSPRVLQTYTCRHMIFLFHTVDGCEIPSRHE